MNFPLVSVICTCYNHKAFIEKAIDSVLCQSYPAVQLIIVDDASTDGSPETIKNHIRDLTVQPLMLKLNVGLCRAFNEGMKLAKGAFIIDLAGDDELDPERISKGIDELAAYGDRYGVHFGDAEIVTADGSHIRFHSDLYPHASIPQGDIYLDLIHKYFICSPTMMFRRSVIEKLGGYDESLAFEDFDFWIRSSRDFYYCYSPNVLVKKRVLMNSLGHSQFHRSGPQRWSTLQVCNKIRQLNRNDQEEQALEERLRYEIMLSLRMRDFRLAFQFIRLKLFKK